ncbi:FAD:protein FMN transferase [Enterovirga sp.]|uniref:FAD:protein FMN transferase n=1 Tax=Enterovirga sp. TaxID=2026350 RepID=UPI002B8DE52A|nr:FAD:protein FMN transferase [Enterovirga sp.]HMO29395.1 FAD:protein FMN transferase [Enterovirga sp.]
MIAISAAAAGMALLPHQAEAAPDVLTWRGQTMGAQASLVLHHPDGRHAARLRDDVLAEMRRLERIFSLYLDDSDLRRLNRQRVLAAPPPEMVEILRQSRDAWDLTGGAFDPTVQPLWAAYGRHFSQADASEGGLPAQELRDCLDRIGLDRLLVSPDRIELPVSGSELTFNGIAQGYITDRVVDLLKAGGIERAMVDMGESRAIGARPDGTGWRVGIADPQRADRIVEVLEVADRAVATSSPYGFRFDPQGRFSHILDPRTGATPQLHASVTVVAGRAALADALSTAFNLMRLGDIESALRKVSGVEAHILPLGEGSSLIRL